MTALTKLELKATIFKTRIRRHQQPTNKRKSHPPDSQSQPPPPCLTASQWEEGAVGKVTFISFIMRFDKIGAVTTREETTSRKYEMSREKIIVVGKRRRLRYLYSIKLNY